MTKKTVNRNNLLLIVLGVLVLLIAILSITIVVVVNINGSGSGSGSGNDDGTGTVIDPSGYEMAGAAEGIGLDEEYQEEGEQTTADRENAIRWTSEAAEVRNAIYDMSFSEAMAYIDSKMAEKDNPDDIFNMQIIKVNVFINAEMYSQALEEANKITNISQLSLWNQEEYYNAMHWIYDGLENKEKADEYVKLWHETYNRRTGGASGAYE